MLGIPSGRVSQIFSGKRNITLRVGQQISDALGFPPAAAERFLSAIEVQRSNSKVGIKSPLKRLAKYKTAESRELSAAEEALVGDPLHFAIIALMETSDFRSEFTWIASRLRSTVLEVRMAVDNLKKVGLVEENASGKLSLPQPQRSMVATRSDVSSTVLRRAHRKILKDASDALGLVNVLQRDMSSMTVAIDLKNLPRAKALIKDFRRKLAVMLESGEQTEVYRLAIQLYPITNLREQRRQQE